MDREFPSDTPVFEPELDEGRRGTPATAALFLRFVLLKANQMTQLCPACGANNRPAAKFCNQCGAALQAATVSVPATPQGAAVGANAFESSAWPELGVVTAATSMAVPVPAPSIALVQSSSESDLRMARPAPPSPPPMLHAHQEVSAAQSVEQWFTPGPPAFVVHSSPPPAPWSPPGLSHATATAPANLFATSPATPAVSAAAIVAAIPPAITPAISPEEPGPADSWHPLSVATQPMALNDAGVVFPAPPGMGTPPPVVRSTLPRWALAGVAAAVVAGVAVLAWSRFGREAAVEVADVPMPAAQRATPDGASNPTTDAVNQSPPLAGASEVSAPVALPVAETPVLTAPVSTVPTASVAASAAGHAPQRAVADAKLKGKSSGKPVASNGASESSDAPAPEVVVTPPPPPSHAEAAPPPGPSSPAEVCGGKNFLGKSACMSEQCAKPAFSSHAQCVRMRQEQQQEEQRRMYGGGGS